ncbi:hypothetical protein ACFQZE_06470 [Paenibacillus sp. GCM10027627]
MNEIKKSYIDRHWKWIVSKQFDESKMSRKTKKAMNQYFETFEDELYLTEEERLLKSLPNCL